jgi:hypothetical protein
MLNKKLFVRWWLGFVFSFVASIICWRLGIFTEIYNKDSSYLSWFILAIYVYMTLWCGIKSWHISNIIEGKIYNKDEQVKLIRQQEIGWFTSDLCLTIGMIGTVVGFIMMLAGFTSVDASDTHSVQKTISSMALGMSTALYTTLAGLICGSMLKIQYFVLSQATAGIVDKEEAENV